RFLDGWVELDAAGFDGPTAEILTELERRGGGGGAPPARVRPALRALPTLQIHVTAGNAPVVAPASAARILSTRSGGVVKLPSGAVLPGAALGLALAAAARAPPGAAADTVIWNQRACIASLVHYVESDEAGALRYAEALRDALAAADAVAPAAPAPAAAGWIQRLRRGALTGARWLPVGGAGRDLRAAVVVVPGPFDLEQHPLSRLVV